MSSWDKFEETKLTPKKAVHSNLNMSDISKNDYEYAQNVWKEFKLLNMGEYHDLYLKTDVLLLSNVFEAFRNTCLEHYELDPAHFYMYIAWIGLASVFEKDGHLVRTLNRSWYATDI